MNKGAMFLLGATLALGFAWSAHMISNAMIAMRQQNIIRVKGVAEQKIKSNWVSWSCEFWCKAEKLNTGYEMLNKSKEAVRTFIEGKGIKADTIAFDPINIEMEYQTDEKGHKTNFIQFYVLRQYLQIEAADVLKLDSISKEITDLIKQGIELRSNKPSFVNTNIENIKIDLLGKATKNAYERAEILAKNSHGKVGALNSASQGVFQITPVNSTDVSDSGNYDTSTVEKSVKAIVTLEFQVEK
ncbi:MAG: SIMPL domain-containing protein [Kiritimatiellae bacterium]|nr:SIMPL domain-containing protein [Kiritimatiellia bacterium]